MNFTKKLLPALAAVTMIALIAASAFVIRTGSVHAAKDERYKNLELFSEAMHLIEQNYVEPVENKKLIEGAISGMLHELDPHSTYLSAEDFNEFKVDTKGEFGGLGITIGMRDNILTVISPLEDTPAYRKGIKAGDKIIKIEDNSTAGITLNEAVKKLRGKKGTDVTITIMRDTKDKPFDVTITRDIIKIHSVKHSMIGDDVGYIRIIQFQNDVSDEIAAAVTDLRNKGAEGFVIDLRNNPGGLLSEAIKVSSIFLPANLEVVYTKDRNGRDQHFRSSMLSTKEKEKPLVVLVNEGSASASEIFSGAVQDHGRGTLIGKNTYGKASVQTIIPIGEGAAMKLTTAKYYTPKGRMIHETGIKPDVVVEQKDDEMDIQEGEDIDPELVSNTAKPKLDLEKDEQLKAAFDKMREMLGNG
ncbi:S41 family peptidase [Limisalsivibrio acetivorans]|uniref:S41 family peptidase n=1 Tax=Limisalsivibrio acetivorans TaxID=1304888 RepID=UPI0003B3B85D|nr:S41 family peptidase [Limisalsivibrio acetivorans]